MYQRVQVSPKHMSSSMFKADTRWVGPRGRRERPGRDEALAKASLLGPDGTPNPGVPH